jgi:NAD(P)H-dependent FMN reductase
MRKNQSSDGVVIIAEYNGVFASLKNAIDLLTDEWRKKPVAFVTVSDGNFAGTQVITSLQFVFWKLGALTVPASLRFPNITTSFD